MPTIDTKFYTFRQNNSGGVFDGPVYVIVEATSAEEANRIAENSEIVYFDGCDKGMDCPCCGDRWYPQWSDDKGDDVPSHYGEPFDEDELENKDRILVIRYGE